MTIALIPPSGPQSEAIVVAAGAATLNYVPDPASIYITGYVRIYDGSPAAGQFKVTPGSAVLAFNTANNGASLTVGYNVASAPGVTETKVNEIIEEVNTLAGEDPESILTTKGDLITRNATVPVRLPVGSNGQVLTADSTQAAGVKWSTPGGGGFTVEVLTGQQIIAGGLAATKTFTPAQTPKAIINAYYKTALNPFPTPSLKIREAADAAAAAAYEPPVYIDGSDVKVQFNAGIVPDDTYDIVVVVIY
jgi:hypothetical protein